MKISTIMYIYRVADMVIMILQWLIIIRSILSWFPHSTGNFIIRTIYEITEPILRPFRSIRIGGMIDFSPLFAILALILFRSFVLGPLFGGIASLLY
ncbi:MAG: hypothetical protein APF84_16085 [Gracilibacter sp. BRH_c7a]|nr:MAG: hypothetical protein APF84_16085 [Gracilibacter sp. BRH_c7a]